MDIYMRMTDDRPDVARTTTATVGGEVDVYADRAESGDVIGVEVLNVNGVTVDGFDVVTDPETGLPTAQYETIECGLCSGSETRSVFVRPGPPGTLGERLLRAPGGLDWAIVGDGTHVFATYCPECA